jgi:hypothetical protein
LAASADIGSELRATIDALLSPPFENLPGVDQRLKDSIGWSGDADLADDRILIGSDLPGRGVGHGEDPPFISR